MNAIELQDVSAGYGGVTTIHNVSLAVRAGEVVALLGANGSGKTTTVGAVCGQATVFAGRVAVNGTDVTEARPRDRARLGLATVPDDRGPFTQMTVAENLRVGDRRGPSGFELDSWFPQLVPLLDRRAGLLSGGEQTLLALARAVVSRPRALVVDEISTGLAPLLAASTMAALRRMADEWGTGVLVAEQSADLALEAADRACVLRRGEVVLDGVPGDIARQPGLIEATYLGDLD